MADADERERNAGRRLYFKNLRKQQKRRRAERKREGAERNLKDNVEQTETEAKCGENQAFVKNCTATTAAAKAEEMEIDEIPAEYQAKKPRKHDDDNYEHAEAQRSGIQASKELQLVGNCTATTVGQADKMEKARSTKAQGKRPKAAENERFFLEIDPKNIKPLGKTIGSGTFGVCRLAQYKDWTVVVKEFRGRNGRENEKLKSEVLHEANVIANLGDHHGLPFLFGVQTKTVPYGVVLQFLGTKDQSLTVWRAAEKKKLSNDEWMSVLDNVAEALQHIHSKGYLHNDLKANNVVLERRYGMQFNPVIIDFGKSTKINSPKPKKTLSKSDQKIYRETYPHIAPEIVSGQATASTASDVYSFGKLIDFICKRVNLNLGAKRLLLENLALSENADSRPQLTEFLSI